MDQEQKKLAEELFFSEKKPLSFVQKLFFGRFDGAKVFPYPKLPLEEMEPFSVLLGKVKRFCDESLDPDWIDRYAEIPAKVLNGLAELGVFGMTVPKAHGGLGMSQQAYCKITEFIAGRCGSTALIINAHQSIGLKSLLLFGTDAQRKQWLEPLAKGKQIAAFSLTEPNAGSDAAGIETLAVFDPEKKVYRINGKKQWTTSGSIAGVLTLMAKTQVDTPSGKQQKVTAFLVTPNLSGFKVTEPSLEKVGMRGTKTANLAFTDMEVPQENVLGPVGGGLKVCLTVLDYGRTTFGSMCTGAAKQLLKDAIEHARTRNQFKRPLASFGLVKKKIANMAALTYAMEAATTLTAGLVDAGHDDIMLESAILKVFASDSLWQILYDTMQIFGGRSFFTSYPYERMMRDARLNMIGEGSNEVLRAFIASVGLRNVGLEAAALMDALKKPWTAPGRLKAGLSQLYHLCATPRVPVPSPELRQEAKRLGRATRRFGVAVLQVLKKYREAVVEKQLDLERLTDCVVALYTTAAVLSRADTAIQHARSTPVEIATAKRYCSMAMRTFENQMRRLFAPEDNEISALSDALTGVHTGG